MVRVHGQIDGAGAGIPKQDPLPGDAAVSGPENAARVVAARGGEKRASDGASRAASGRAKGMSQRGHVNHIGIGRIDADARDRLRIGQPHMLPTLAAVDRFVYAVALHDAAAQLGFAHTDEHHVGIGLRDRDRAHRRAMDLTVGYGKPRHSTIGGLPQSSAGRSEVIFQRPLRAAGRRL